MLSLEYHFQLLENFVDTSLNNTGACESGVFGHSTNNTPALTVDNPCVGSTNTNNPLTMMTSSSSPASSIFTPSSYHHMLSQLLTDEAMFHQSNNNISISTTPLSILDTTAAGDAMKSKSLSTSTTATKRQVQQQADALEESIDPEAYIHAGEEALGNEKLLFADMVPKDIQKVRPFFAVFKITLVYFIA